MAWTSPMTAVTNEIFTASQFNENVRDNLLEAAPAKAANPGGYFVTTGQNSISEREAGEDFVGDYEGTSSTDFTDLATPGPSVTVTTGERALVLFSAYTESIGDSSRVAQASFEVSGETEEGADSAWAVYVQNGQIQAGTSRLVSLTAGENTFTMKYRRVGGSGDVNFSTRRIIVFPL